MITTRSFIKRSALLLVYLIWFVGSPVHSQKSTAATFEWTSKVDPWILQTSGTGETEFLVMISEQADLSAADQFSTRLEKGAYVYQQLTATAMRTQKPLISFLQSRGIAHRSYWVANMIWVRADTKTIQLLALRPDVAHLSANPSVTQQFPTASIPLTTLAPVAGPEWNLIKVRSPDVWNAGFTGQGVVIGGQDTGYQWDHPALKDKYRGWNGQTADHNYNWHDAIHPPSIGGSCGPDSPIPCDDHSHGTHTMGIMVGDDGLGNQVGMAPGAKWIGCRNMDQGVGTPATYAECYQWFIAPTDLQGNNPRPDLAPDVINNSWSCPPSEGCTDPDVLRLIVDNVHQAGILTVHAASNSGPYCATVNSPAAIYDSSFTVGATDSSDNIASFSSRGPVDVDGSHRLKPDISAPGVGIRSSFPTAYGLYAYLSGTSMAAPHVAGLAALLLSADPNLSGQTDRIEKYITHNTLPRTTGVNCGTIPGSQIPNNTYGWGRIDAWKTVTNFDLELFASPTMTMPGETIQYSIKITQRYPGITTNVKISDQLPNNVTFVSASLPYNFSANTVEWNFSSLNHGETKTVELVVKSPQSGLSLINNQAITVISDQTNSSPFLDPVLVFVANYFNLFPFVPKP